MNRPLNTCTLFSTVTLSLLAGSVAAVAQDINAPTGYLSFGAAYSERYGETVFASLVEDDFLGTGVGADVSAEYNRSGYRVSANLDTDINLSIPGFLTDPVLDISVYLDNHAWQGNAYDSKRIGVEADLVFPVRQNMVVSTGVFYYDDTISNVNGNTSPIVLAGQQATSGAQIGLHYSTLDTPIRPSSGVALGVTAQYAGLGGDTNWTSLTVNGSVYHPLPMNGIAKVNAIAGQMRSLNGNAISITERAFLGNDLPRGFAYGGLGPRDDDGGSINTSLGGESYTAVSVQTEFPMFDTNTGAIYGSVFWDGGSVWNLSGTPVGASGLIDEAMYWRASYGVSLSWVGNMGQIRLSWAEPYQYQVGDIMQPLSVSFSAAF